MKVVTWNCNGALRKKLSAIDQLGADLLIIQECEDPDRSTSEYRQWARTWLWHGDNKNKGIGIFPRSSMKIERLDWEDDGLQSFLPCRINDRFNLIAVWTKYANSPNFRYIGQLWKYLQNHGSRLQDTPFVLCGDFNSNTCWDEWDRWWNHSDVVRDLEELGAVSVYHSYFEESQGTETRPTLFHQRNREKSYHVDYAFVTSTLWNPSKGTVELGSHDEWLEISDHMPLQFVITDGQQHDARPA
jgi:exonuclease III